MTTFPAPRSGRREAAVGADAAEEAGVPGADASGEQVVRWG